MEEKIKELQGLQEEQVKSGGGWGAIWDKIARIQSNVLDPKAFAQIFILHLLMSSTESYDSMEECLGDIRCTR